MGDNYTVSENDCGQSIANDNGFYTLGPLVQANPDLAESCASNFDVLAPGTCITVPDLVQKDEAAATSACHTYQVKTVVKDLVLTIQTADAKMVGRGSWELTLSNGSSKKGDFSGDPIRYPNWPVEVTNAELKLQFSFRREPKNIEPSSRPEMGFLDETVHLSVGSLDPLTGTEEQRNRAVQKLLTNLGYYGGEIDGVLGNRSHAAIHKFRAEYNVPDSDDLLSAETIRAIVEQQQATQIGNSNQSFQTKVRDQDKPISVGPEAKSKREAFTTLASRYVDPHDSNQNDQKKFGDLRFFPKTAHVALSDSGSSKNPNVIRMKWRKFIFIDNGRWCKKGRDFGVIYGRHVYLCEFVRDAAGSPPAVDGDPDRLDTKFFQAMGSNVKVNTRATAWWALRDEFDWSKLLIVIPDLHLMTAANGDIFRGGTFEKLDPELDLLLFAKKLIALTDAIPGLYVLQLGDSYDLWVGCEPRLYRKNDKLQVKLYSPPDQRWSCGSSVCPGHPQPGQVCKTGLWKCRRVSCQGVHLRPDDDPCSWFQAGKWSCGRTDGEDPACGGHSGEHEFCDTYHGYLWMCNKTEPPCPGHRSPVAPGFGVQSAPCPETIDATAQLVTWIGDIRGTNSNWVGKALKDSPLPAGIDKAELATHRGTHLNPACKALESLEQNAGLTYLHGNHDDYLILSGVTSAAGLAPRSAYFETDGVLIEHGHRLEHRLILTAGGPIPTNYDGATTGYEATLKQFHDYDRLIRSKEVDQSPSDREDQQSREKTLTNKEDFADWAAQNFQQTQYMEEYAQVWVGRTTLQTYPAPHIFGIGHTHDPVLTYIDIRLNLD
jgi:peptidoglycan hydrolase-like protein with peptidoglycan-binding domain